MRMVSMYGCSDAYEFDRDNITAIDVVTLYCIQDKGLSISDAKAKVQEYCNIEETTEWEDRIVPEKVWDDALWFMKKYTTWNGQTRSMSDEQLKELAYINCDIKY